MSEETNDAFLAPFRKRYDQAREIEKKSELLMRAAYQVADRADSEALIKIAEQCFAEGRRIRDSVPVPSDSISPDAATVIRP